MLMGSFEKSWSSFYTKILSPSKPLIIYQLLTSQQDVMATSDIYIYIYIIYMGLFSVLDCLNVAIKYVSTVEVEVIARRKI